MSRAISRADFVDATSDLPSRCIRAAARLHRAVRAIGLAGSIDDGVGLGDVSTQVLEWRHWLRSTWPCGQRYSSAWASHWKSLLDSVSSLRWVLSHTDTCGSICFS